METCPWRVYYCSRSDAIRRAVEREAAKRTLTNSLQRHLTLQKTSQGATGFSRIERCREALRALDMCGWARSFHQKQFHESYIRACARVFFKTDGPGAFARNQKQLLELNGWDHIAQEVLVSTPRRFGKTVSISMFAAALIFSTASVECSIYSTCKRISTKLLRKVVDYLNRIHEHLKVPKFKEIRANQEELVLQGPEGPQDVRIMSSYPSKVLVPPTLPPFMSFSPPPFCKL